MPLILAELIPLQDVQAAVPDVPVVGDTLAEILGELDNGQWGAVLAAVGVSAFGALVVPLVGAIIRARSERSDFAEASAKRMANYGQLRALRRITELRFKAAMQAEKILMTMNKRRVSTEMHADLRRVFAGAWSAVKKVIL